MDLRLDQDELNICVQCGLCLPSCPTFRVTGEESKSPRGRIQLMREVQLNDAPVTEEVLESFRSCVQCRGCEPACPSGVPYGRLMESARETLVDELTPKWQRAAMKPLSHPTTLQLGTKVLALAQRAKLVPKSLGLPEVPLNQDELSISGDDVFLFTGCVMDAWQRDIHRASQQVIEAAGFGVTPTNSLAPCCGALHTHAGLTDESRARATQTMKALGSDSADDQRPILVDSAGCGAAMKDYGHLLKTDDAEKFSARVFDIHEWLADHVDALPEVEPLDVRVAVQDPCHLRHVQKVHGATRTVLARFVREIVELDDDGMCCGAGGAYSLLERDLAGQIRDRKFDAISRADADVVASANPGCSMHLSQSMTPIAHPMTLVARALDKSGDGPGG